MHSSDPTLSPTDPIENEADRTQKIQALRDMVLSAERTIQSAKAMLLQLEGKKKLGRPKKSDASEGERVIEGTFDGQLMFGTDGKQYPVPANYASKSKLVEGDHLKLTITPEGTFLYKQIGPLERKHAIGIVSQDESGNYYVVADGRPYRILLASITYFKATPGDEVAIVLPRDLEASWAAIENIIQKGADSDWAKSYAQAVEENSVVNSWKKDLTLDEEAAPAQPGEVSVHATDASKEDRSALLDAWVRDMEEIEKEIKKQ
ncbi:MAG: hypothetical protein WDN67_05620 [Candidatus Moraniibacteriota bacterium]